MEQEIPTYAQAPADAEAVFHTAGAGLETVSALLHAVEAAEPAEELAYENRLVQVRLGLASGLFAALRAKHPATASHSLRVAMGCSSWALAMHLPKEQCDEIEVAALLHDIGKIGVPDNILLKPGQLSSDEYNLVERHRQIGVDILRACCSSEETLRIIQHCGDWFNGSREGQAFSGEALPLGGRLLAIVDAFDAMTTDQVYRRAMSRERAMSELFEYAGTQFDPNLVKEFFTYLTADQIQLATAAARRWLKDLQARDANSLWQLNPTLGTAAATSQVFQQRLLESMHDAVVFVDNGQRILLWNQAAERMTGISAVSVSHKFWSPQLLQLRDERQKLIQDENCPVGQAMRSGEQSLRRLCMTSRGGKKLEVDAHIVPVYSRGGVAHGVALLLHDASTQITLEQRVRTLHEKASRDPLTQVGNRAEFDRALVANVQRRLVDRQPCSLIICDIDHFKKVNDTFGHQAGDAVLINFAGLLKRHCREGDLVARYGGEEFVMLCSDCDNATATERAEELRAELELCEQENLDGQSITASFGVTELQDGDTAETMLRRADRGLYQAKAGGRNRVVQLGAGIGDKEPAKKTVGGGWLAWLLGNSVNVDMVLARTLVTAVPFNVVVEKLRGFIADHHAEVDAIAEGHIGLRIEGDQVPFTRRNDDRPVPFCIELKFEEAPPGEGRLAGATRTLVHVSLRPQRNRDRRRQDTLERAQQLLGSLKSYLVAQDLPQSAEA